MSSVKPKTADLRVTDFERLDSPASIKGELSTTSSIVDTVASCREQIRKALTGEDSRLMVIVGPCSIHDPKAALEYATKLSQLRKQVEDRLLIVMRVYFEKPRTTVGWKGLINDPNLDETFDIAKGLRLARQILLDINALGLPCATEFLDPVVPQYTADLVSWAAIGARTTESQTHREMASGLSMPVGLKNATDGSLDVAINAMTSARQAHAFLGLDQAGHSSIVKTKGNPDTHIVLRGGNGKPNCSKAHIAFTKTMLESFPQGRLIMVDCSHGNSNKDFTKQPNVFADVLDTYQGGEKAILGMMLESNLIAGKQSLGPKLEYGKSITDGCIDWETTETLLVEAHKRLA